MMLLGVLMFSVVTQLVESQEYIVPEYVRADQYGTAYFKASEPKIGPTKSVFHIENLIKLESELIGLGEIILETENKLHQREEYEKQQRLEKKKTKDKNKKHGNKNQENFFDFEDEHEAHDYTKEFAYLEKMREVNSLILENSERFTENPLAMFPLRKRLALEWPKVLTNITNCSMVHEYPAIQEHFRYIQFFLEADGDLDAAHEDLLRLQKVYRIPVSSLARGWWGSRRTSPLNISDIIAIADICLDREDMDGALEWLLQVAKLVKGLGLHGKEKLRYMNILGSAYLRLDRFQEAKIVYSNILREDSTNRIAKSNLDLMETRAREKELSAKRRKEREKEAALRKAKRMMGKMGKVDVDDKNDDDDEKKDGVMEDSEQVRMAKQYRAREEEPRSGYTEEWWMKFCRGDVKPNRETESNLYCHHKYIPLMDRSIRVEVLSINPPIYLLKDVLTYNMMNQSIYYAAKEMEKRIHAFTVEDASSALVYTDTNSWMEPFVFRMRNITYQTYNVETHDRVNLLSAIRMYNVGAGGTSNPGRAEMKITRRKSGLHNQFIGRYIHFMKVPEIGGHFVFPWIGITVQPEQGDILFWQFRTPTGKVHPKLYHWLECPVMLGDLWYAEQMVEHQGMISKVDFNFVPKKTIKTSKSSSKTSTGKPKGDKQSNKDKKTKASTDKVVKKRKPEPTKKDPKLKLKKSQKTVKKVRKSPK